MQTNLDKMNSLNSSMAVSFAELDTMRKDVQSNWTKIVEGVDLGVLHIVYDRRDSVWRCRATESDCNS